MNEKQKVLLNELIDAHKRAIDAGVTEVQIAHALDIPVIAINGKVLDPAAYPEQFSGSGKRGG